MLDFRVLTFLCVCKEMNFTRAAEQLHITQPAVTQHIHWLEEKYQTTLFLFSGKKMSLTKEGDFLKNRLSTMALDVEHTKELLEQMKQEKQKIVFGVTLTIGEYVIPKAIAEYLKKYPNTDVQVVIANTSQLIQRLEDGSIDFALVEGVFDKHNYETRIFSREPYIAVSNRPWEKCCLQDLFGENIIVREGGSGTRDILEKNLLIKNHGISDFRGKIEINNLEAIKTLVRAGRGISFLFRVAVAKELEEKTLYEIPVEDMQVEHDFTFIWRKSSQYGETYEEIFELLRSEE